MDHSISELSSNKNPIDFSLHGLKIKLDSMGTFLVFDKSKLNDPIEIIPNRNEYIYQLLDECISEKETWCGKYSSR
jgi:hypothetical protein